MAIENDADDAALPSLTELAMDRTLLAHDRTLMAWVRTATSLISFGFTIYKFFQYLQERQRLEPDGRVLGPRRFAMLMISIGLASLLLASTVAARDETAGAPGPSGATALPILDLNPLARPTPEKTAVAQGSLFNFTPPRMNLVGLIPAPDRGESSIAMAHRWQ